MEPPFSFPRLLAVAAFGTSSAALAQGSPPANPSSPAATPAPRPRAYVGDDELNFAVPTTRRGGVQLALLAGPQLLSATGTPTDFAKRSDAFRVDTGATVGASTSFFLGGALTDWFVFHLGLQSSTASKKNLEVAATGFLAGIEVWPLFARGGSWRDLGVGADFGTGGADIKDKQTGIKVANAGTYSHARAVVFWEAARFWKINVGPALGYEVLWSATYTQTAGWLTLRAVFYGAP